MKNLGKIEVKGLGKGIEDFFPVVKIRATYKENGRDPFYYGNLEGEHTYCPICSPGDFHMQLVVEINARGKNEKEYSARRAVLFCRRCGYGYDVNKGKEIEKLELIHLDGKKQMINHW
jgi:hypothetical protein